LKHNTHNARDTRHRHAVTVDRPGKVLTVAEIESSGGDGDNKDSDCAPGVSVSVSEESSAEAGRWWGEFVAADTAAHPDYSYRYLVHAKNSRWVGGAFIKIAQKRMQVVSA
jgi:hypothetical protein